jgi:hypothetical protein
VTRTFNKHVCFNLKSLCDKVHTVNDARAVPPEPCAQVSYVFFKEHVSHGGKRPVAKPVGSGHGTLLDAPFYP